MQADYSVEVGADFPYLEFPWDSGDGRARYFDLVSQPELLLNVTEAHRYPELGEFLAAINGANSVLASAKCDAWRSTEITEDEQIFGAAEKFGSYVDLIFRNPAARMSLEPHERLAKDICQLLGRAPEISAAAEFIIRRCYYRRDPARPEEHDEGFSVTFYLFGYGEDEYDSRQRWVIALKVVENALLQLAAAARRAASEP